MDMLPKIYPLLQVQYFLRISAFIHQQLHGISRYVRILQAWHFFDVSNPEILVTNLYFGQFTFSLSQNSHKASSFMQKCLIFANDSLTQIFIENKKPPIRFRWLKV